MNTTDYSIQIFKISLVAAILLCFSTISLSQQSSLPPGLIQFKDSMQTDIFLDLKNADKGILRYRKKGQEEFHRVSLGHIQAIQLYPHADGALKQTFVVRSRKIGEEYQLVLVKQLLAGDYSLLVELNAEAPFFWEDPNGEVIHIPAAKASRKKLMDKLLQKHDLQHHNRTAYAYQSKSLRQFTAYLNGEQAQKYPGYYLKGKLEYLRKNWRFTKLSTNVGFSIVIPTEERMNLETVHGQPSNIIALSTLFEMPFYRKSDLTFIQEIGLRKELTYIQAEDQFQSIDFKLDASFLTGELAVKYSGRSGKYYPFVRAGLGSSLLLSESNRFSRSSKASNTTSVLTTKIVSNVTLHPGLRVGTEFYLGGPYLLTIGATYTREMMLFRTISSSSNAFGVYTAVNFY